MHLVTKMMRLRFIAFAIVILSSILIISGFVAFRRVNDTDDPYSKWTVYGGGSDNIKYSSLDQINTGNVKKLKVAWEYSAGEASTTNTTDMKTNPIIINGVLYGLNPQLKLFALNALTGKVKWVYDPGSIPEQGANKGRGPFGPSTKISRGLTYYNGGKNDQRIFYTPGGGHMLYCVDAITGKLVTSFGKGGRIDLHDELDIENPHDLHISNTSPGIIYKDLIILGSRLSENAESAPGHVRAFDVHTGKRRWIFHTIPHPGEAGYETWENPDAYKYVGGANVWGGFSLDEKRGIVFAGTGSATPDFYGGNRKGNNLYANSILALDAASGKLKWHYQTVHHDLWDYDHAAHPILVTIKKDNKSIDAVVQTTKQGFIFMFNRETGEPIYPINEVPVPKSELAGEWTSPTQPVPTFFEPFVRQRLTEADLLKEGIPDSSYQEILKRFRSYKTDNMWNPPSLQGTLQSPGWNGGSEWGGPTFDPTSGLMYLNANESPWVMKMEEVKNKVISQRTNLEAGKLIYSQNCSGCHGQDRRAGESNPALSANPSLANISQKSSLNPQTKYDEASFKSLVTSGRNNMPPFAHLSEAQKTALASFILDLDNLKSQPFKDSNVSEVPEHFRAPYSFSGGMSGGGKFLTNEGYPAVAPPWGHLTAIDLNTGKKVWKQTIGDYPEMKAKGIHTGSENFGGSVVTAGGLVFIAATRDEKIRAFNKKTGELLWEADLPAAGIATPAVYEVNGKQFVVIACGGGGKQRTRSGDKYLAFALPDLKK